MYNVYHHCHILCLKAIERVLISNELVNGYEECPLSVCQLTVPSTLEGICITHSLNKEK